MTTEATKTEVGSYFISNYPPFSQWTAEELPDVAASAGTRRRSDGAAGPVPAHSLLPQALQVLLLPRLHRQERAATSSATSRPCRARSSWSASCRCMGGRPFRFVYFGGGTPSFLSAKQLTSLVDRLRANITWDQAEEVTFECEPGTLAEPKLQTLTRAGRHAAEPGRRELQRRDPARRTAGPTCRARSTKSWDWIQRGRLSERQHRPDRRHGRRDVGQLAGVRPAARSSCRPTASRSTRWSCRSTRSTRKDILGNQIETPVADWPTKRAWVELRLRRTARGRLSRVERLHAGEGPDARSTSATATTCGTARPVGHRRRQLRPRLAACTTRTSPSGATTCGAARTAANCRCAAGCGRRRISCWSAR